MTQNYSLALCKIVQAQAWLVLADGYWIYVQVEVCQFLPLHFLVWFDEVHGTHNWFISLLSHLIISNTSGNFLLEYKYFHIISVLFRINKMHFSFRVNCFYFM